MRKLLFLLLELFMVTLAIGLAHSFEQSFQYLPKAIISLPQVDYSINDLKTLYVYFIGIHAFIFALTNHISGAWTLDSSQSCAQRIFILMLAYSLSTLSLFLTSSSNFDPNLIVGIALFCAALYLILSLLGGLGAGLLATIKNLISSIIKRALSISGALIIVFTLLPGLLAGAFVKDRDFANRITQIRMLFSNSGEVQYSFISAIGDFRFQQPMLVKSPASDPDTLYVLQRNGKLFSVSRQNPSEPQLIIDLEAKVGFVEMENGALGFDFHPRFNLSINHSPYLYLYYTSVINGLQKNYLSRFDVSLGSPQQKTISELPLMVLERESSGFHNGGSVEFGGDGFLYLAIGEGVRTPDKKYFSNTLRMGVLRIDVDNLGGEISKPITRRPANGITQHYSIPLDNPFLGDSNILEEYWVLGLRNPFRISYDATEDQWWAGDVGSTKWEEINLLESGKHYQFPFIEGTENTGKALPSPMFGTQQAPVYTYFHTATERAVIGGMVYRGSLFRELEDHYLFADNYSGNLYKLDRSAQDAQKVMLAASNDYAQRGISSVSQHASGDIYVTTLGKASGRTGKILKLIRGRAAQPDLPISTVETTPLTTADVAEIYSTNCARCHGAEGKGNGPDQKLLNITITDFTAPDYRERRTILELQSIIAEGGSGNGLSPMMPPWNRVLSKQEIESLALYISTMQQSLNQGPES